MANPSSVGVEADYNPAMIVTDTTGGSTTIDVKKQYVARHLGVDNQSTPAPATGTIYLTYQQSGTAITANGAEGTNKFPILSGDVTIIGPGASTLGWRAAAGSPVLSLVPMPSNGGVM